MCDFCNTDIKTNGTCKECGKPKCDNCASLSNPDVHIACFKQREIKHRVRQDPISPSRIRPVPRPTY
jgi:hypothetical protein